MHGFTSKLQHLKVLRNRWKLFDIWKDIKECSTRVSRLSRKVCTVWSFSDSSEIIIAYAKVDEDQVMLLLDLHLPTTKSPDTPQKPASSPAVGVSMKLDYAALQAFDSRSITRRKLSDQ